jgi:hypothetical protein
MGDVRRKTNLQKKQVNKRRVRDENYNNSTST